MTEIHIADLPDGGALRSTDQLAIDRDNAGTLETKRAHLPSALSQTVRASGLPITFAGPAGGTPPASLTFPIPAEIQAFRGGGGPVTAILTARLRRENAPNQLGTGAVLVSFSITDGTNTLAQKQVAIDTGTAEPITLTYQLHAETSLTAQVAWISGAGGNLVLDDLRLHLAPIYLERDDAWPLIREDDFGLSPRITPRHETVAGSFVRRTATTEANVEDGVFVALKPAPLITPPHTDAYNLYRPGRRIRLTVERGATTSPARNSIMIRRNFRTSGGVDRGPQWVTLGLFDENTDSLTFILDESDLYNDRGWYVRMRDRHTVAGTMRSTSWLLDPIEQEHPMLVSGATLPGSSGSIPTSYQLGADGIDMDQRHTLRIMRSIPPTQYRLHEFFWDIPMLQIRRHIKPVSGGTGDDEPNTKTRKTCRLALRTAPDWAQSGTAGYEVIHVDFHGRTGVDLNSNGRGQNILEEMRLIANESSGASAIWIQVI